MNAERPCCLCFQEGDVRDLGCCACGAHVACLRDYYLDQAPWGSLGGSRCDARVSDVSEKQSEETSLH